MIESKNDTSKNLERALQALKQAQQRVANEKKKQNEKKRKAENHHKYIMGGIIVKYFPDCYRYDEGKLNRILSVALQTKECQQIISKIKAESRETTPPQSTLPNAENESEGVVCLSAAKRGKGQQAALRNSPSQAALATLKRSPASLCEHLRSDKSQSAALICPQSLSMRPTTLSTECRCCVWVMSRNRQAHVFP